MPPDNLLGFGSGDLVELALAAFLVAIAVIARWWVEPVARKLASKTGWCMVLLAFLPLAFRLALLPHRPVPTPNVYDEFGHLLVADTLLHFRMANPPHLLHQFFETFFVLQTPSYASIYPIGQGLVLAIGRAIFGLPWAGVLLATAALCTLCYWMLRAWTSPEWALIGGLLSVIAFGPLSSWMNSYWGGSLAGVCGCLVFGSLPRLRVAPRARYGALAGLGIGLHWLTRPYETIFLLIATLLFLVPTWRSLAKPALAAALVLVPAIAVSLAHNKQVTGSWTTLPYTLSRYQYGVPAAFTWQSNPQPHNELTPEQQMQYKMQTAFRALAPETIQSYFLRLAYRARFYRFFFLPALYVALPFFLARLREPRFLWVALTIAIFALGVNSYPFFEVHYLGALTCLFVLASVAGLEQLKPNAAHLLLLLCLAHFVFWYSRAFLGLPAASRHAAVDQQLVQATGKQLVFVRYWPQHVFQDEWVYNAADIDHARIVWARDLGADEDEKLRRYYPDRTAWLLEPDAMPPRLTRYFLEPLSPSQPSAPPQEKRPPTRAKTPPLRLEQVH